MVTIIGSVPPFNDGSSALSDFDSLLGSLLLRKHKTLAERQPTSTGILLRMKSGIAAAEAEADSYESSQSLGVASCRPVWSRHDYC